MNCGSSTLYLCLSPTEAKECPLFASALEMLGGYWHTGLAEKRSYDFS